MRSSFLEFVALILAAVSVATVLVPNFKTKNKVLLVCFGVITVALTGFQYYLVSYTGRGVFERAACIVFPDGPYCKADRQPSLIQSKAETNQFSATDSISDPVPVAPLIATPSPAPSAPPLSTDSPSLATFFAPATLGTNIEYIQAKLGPPISDWGDTQVFLIEGCEVEVEVDGAGEFQLVKALQMDVTPECSPSWKAMGDAFEDFPAVHDTTIGQFRSVRGINDPLRMQSWCISDCGNAADPVVEWVNQGSRAKGFLDVSVGTKLVGDDYNGDEVRAFTDKLNYNRPARIRAPGPYVRFCDVDAPILVGNIFDRLLIRSIRIGFILGFDGC